MIAGPRFSEPQVLALGHAFEQATAFHKTRPPLNPTTIAPPIARPSTHATSSGEQERAERERQYGYSGVR